MREIAEIQRPQSAGHGSKLARRGDGKQTAATIAARSVSSSAAEPPGGAEIPILRVGEDGVNFPLPALRHLKTTFRSSRVGRRAMRRSHSLLASLLIVAPILFGALVGIADAAPPAPFQPAGPVGPLNGGILSRAALMSRPIFARPAAPSAAAPKPTTQAAPPLHRRPRPFVSKKAVAAPSSPDVRNPAPPPHHGSSSIPGHRQSLGW